MSKIPKYTAALLLTILLLPMWVMWAVMDLATDNDNLVSQMREYWL